MAPNLAEFRDRLKTARVYLVGRIAEDDDPDRKIPDTGWMRILDSLQTCLEAVEAVMAEDANEGAARHQQTTTQERRHSDAI